MNKETTALIIGNGPSVDRLDPALLGHFTTYGCNHIYKKFPDWGRPTDHVLISDSRRLPEIGDAYRNYSGQLWIGDERYSDPPAKYIRKLVQRDFHPLRQLMKRRYTKLPPLRRVQWPQLFSGLVFDKGLFTFDLKTGFNFGQSVTISAIQLAVMHGHKVVCLTGMETSYSVPKDYFSGMESSISYVNDVFIANPRRWMEPYLVILQIHLEAIGVTLLDCTPNGKLKFISKGHFLQASPWFEKVEHRLS